ncbi:M1 family metallopeptidase [Pseudoalteromonas tunicata]|uniref:M1 family metallopeptidase n=1 Tax=Pseudoalteromonas tunicata TaxID=314281 RepID=UPI00273D638B|nr:M1 family metallopeptidase [Pseudoalteromonas tunicata]MDP5213333.1 M1 family metallopeptidase [Pseudoalteromonas tunicata]
MKKLTLSALSLAIASASICAQANEYVIEKFAKPSAQSVSLILDPAQEQFSGSTTITLEVLTKTKIIELNGEDYNAKLVKLSGDGQCSMTANALKTGKVQLICAHEINPGNYTLTIDFDAPFNKQSVGLYKTIDHGTPYLFTQFEMSDARRAFPVFDEPEYKIPFQLNITSPSNLKVFANTEAVKQESNNGQTTHQFATTKPLPSYLVAFAVGDFEQLPVKGMPIEGNIVTTKGKIALGDYAAKHMPAILNALEQYFGIPYVYSKLDSVAVPEFPFGAMENAGLVTYREDILLIDEAHANQNAKQSSVSVIAHELAHQWYGNLVTMKWWNDLWLNEAFASWMAAKVTHQLFPEFESNLSLPQNNVMDADARLSTKPIRKPIKTEADIMDGLGLAYSKGSAVLSMVENWIGEDAFQQGIQAYMQQFAFKNAEASDLWTALAKSSKQDVASVLKSFIEQSSFPLLNITQDKTKLTIKQTRFANAGVDAPAQLWTVPVVIKYGRGDEVKTAKILLNKPSQIVQLDFEPEWIYPDENAMGYYRWVLPTPQLNALLANAEKVLTPREKRAFISGSDALLSAGLLSGGDLLKTLGQFIDDAHPRVVGMALGYIESQKGVFIDESNEALWQKYISAKAQSAITKYGLVAVKNEDPSISKLRPQLVSLLAFEAKDPAIIATAKQQAQRYLADSTQVDPYLAGTYLKIAAFNGDAALLKAYQTAFETTQDPEKRTNLLVNLSYFKSAALQTEALNYTLGDKVTASDMRYVMGGNLYKKERKALFQQWVMDNYALVSKKLPPFVLPSLPNYLGGGCSQADLDKTTAFFAPKVEEVAGFSRSLSKLNESVTDCINLRTREVASVNSYLKTL